jgi:DNA-binding NtrC family response regulator
MPIINSMPATVLVVDDDAASREILRRWLEQWGFQVCEAENASIALEEMLAHEVDIVFCDIMMPGRDGIWLAERMRERWPRAAIVMATGMGDVPTVLRAKNLGVVDYVIKPFGRELLHQALQRALVSSGCASG